MLFTEFYGDIYGDDSDIAKFIQIGYQLTCVIKGCIYDEFQREVYANPDMTLDEINQLYCSICASYGMFEARDVDYAWMYVPHNFTSPVYYISYAVSSLAALQIWEIAQDNYQTGVDVYLSILEEGAYGDGYLTILEKCGLSTFTEEGAVASILQPVLDEMERLDEAQG